MDKTSRSAEATSGSTTTAEKREHARDRRDRELKRCAREAFEKHELVREIGASRWSLRRRMEDGRFSYVYWVEIVVLEGGKLLVHGDIEAVIFASYSGEGAPERVVRWMGDHPDFDYYVHQKASIGTGHKIVDALDDAAAADDILEEIAEDKERSEACGLASENTETLEEGLERLTRWSEPVEMVRNWLYDNLKDPDTEWLARVGRVIDARVYFAHAAVRRLCEIWDARPLPEEVPGASSR